MHIGLSKQEMIEQLKKINTNEALATLHWVKMTKGSDFLFSKTYFPEQTNRIINNDLHNLKRAITEVFNLYLSSSYLADLQKRENEKERKESHFDRIKETVVDTDNNAIYFSPKHACDIFFVTLIDLIWIALNHFSDYLRESLSSSLNLGKESGQTKFFMAQHFFSEFCQTNYRADGIVKLREYSEGKYCFAQKHLCRKYRYIVNEIIQKMLQVDFITINCSGPRVKVSMRSIPKNEYDLSRYPFAFYYSKNAKKYLEKNNHPYFNPQQNFKLDNARSVSAKCRIITLPTTKELEDEIELIIDKKMERKTNSRQHSTNHLTTR